MLGSSAPQRRAITAPLLTGPKLRLAQRRLLETALGGMRLVLPTPVPKPIVGAMWVLWSLPAMVGIAVTLGGNMDVHTTAGVVGGIVAALVLGVDVLARVLVARDSGGTDSVGVFGLAVEEDDVELEGLWTPEAWKFIVPPKPLWASGCRLVLAFLAAATIACAVHPHTVAGFVAGAPVQAGHIVGNIWGWTVGAMTLYSCLAAPPPELAAWDASSGGHTAPAAAFQRPLFVFLLCLPSWVVWVASPVLPPVTGIEPFIIALRVIFWLLPLLWMVGGVPPIAALVESVLELGALELVGVPPTFSAPRFLLQLVVALVVSVVAWALTDVSGVALGVSAAVLLLLQRLVLVAFPAPWAPTPADGNGSTGATDGTSSRRPSQSSDTSVKPAQATATTAPLSARWRLAGWDAVGITALVAAPIVVRALNAGTCSASECLPASVTCTIAGGLWLIAYMIRQLQSPSWTRFLLNPTWSYTPAADTEAPIIVCRAPMGWVFRALKGALTADLLVWAAYTLPTDAALAWTPMAICRFVQRATATPFMCALEVMLVSVINVSAPSVITPAGAAGWLALPLWLRLVLCGIIVSRAVELHNKVLFMVTHLSTAWSEYKLRFPGVGIVVGMSFLLSPVLVGVAAVAALLRVPLLPVLGLPVFVPAFVRPRRQWPAFSGPSSATNTDAALYQQMAASLLDSLAALLPTGGLGELEAGSMLLVRQDTLVAVIQVVEVTAGQAHVVIRGLEQQATTSCHHVEAGEIDQVFNQISREQGAQRSESCTSASPWSVITPLTVAPVNSYGATIMSLAAVIDQAAVLTLIDQLFFRFLCVGVREASRQGRLPDASGCDLSDMELEIARRRFPTSWWQFLAAKVPLEDAASQSSISNDDPEAKQHTVVSQVRVPVPPSAPAQVARPFVTPAPMPAPAPAPAPVPVPAPATVAMRGGAPPVNRRRPSDDIDALLEELDDDEPAPAPAKKFARPGNTVRRDSDDIDALLQDVDGDSSPAAPAGNHHVVNFLPSPTKPAVPEAGRFAEPQYKPLAGTVSSGGAAAAASSAPLPSTRKSAPGGGAGDLRELANVLYCLVQVSGLGCSHGDAEDAGPAHVYTVFQGRIPESLSANWLTSRPRLVHLAVQAYRLATKAALDAAVMMTLDDMVTDSEDSFEELWQSLEDLRSGWFIGPESSSEWAAAMARQEKQLFGLRAPTKGDGGTTEYSGQLYSLQRQTAFIAELNPEVVFGFWSSLAQELLYFTSDDDERYSIQAHKLLLRNILVQSAVPPLGYPVWTSGVVPVRASVI